MKSKITSGNLIGLPNALVSQRRVASVSFVDV